MINVDKKPCWLIQSNMGDIDTKSMVAEVVAQGMVAHSIDYNLGHVIHFREYCDNIVDQRYPFICYGSIDFVRQVQRRSKFIPGAWCNFYNMKCSTYHAHLGEHLLNQQYMMMPVGDLLRRWEELIRVFYPMASIIGNKSLFIRPDSGAKPFTGYVVKPHERNKIQTLIQAVGPETLVVVSPKKEISAEWRFVICDKKVVTGCRYLPDESSDTPPPSSLRLAEAIASKEWQPDICYTVDIVTSNGKMYLLEINSFSCSGFHDCDIASIVKCASEAAVREWREYNVR